MKASGSAGAPDWSRYRPVAGLLREHARRRPDKPFLVSIDQDGRRLTFGELWRLSNRLARWLGRAGVPAGGRVAVLAGNRLETLALYYAIQRYGAAFCAVDVAVNARHVREMLGRMRPELVLWHEGLDVAGMGGERGWTRFGDCAPGGRAADGGLFEALEDLDDGDDPPVPESGPEDPCVVSFTSGTAAAPKGVIHTFGNYFWIAEQVVAMWALTEADRMLEYRSVGWASSHMLSLQPALAAGAALVFADGFSRSRFFGWLRDHRPTMAIGVPAVINMLLGRTPSAEDRAALAGLRFVSSSTAPLMTDQHRRFEDTYGVRLVQLYGMSEGGIVAANHVGGRRVGSVGRPGLYQNLRVVGADGAELPRGETGEIEIGGAQTAWGYLLPGGRTEKIRGRRLRTGDLGFLDGDGFLHVAGRAKDVIIRGGVNVAPLEVENVLAALPGVAEAAVVGVPDEIFGEEVAGFVALRAGAAATAVALRARCAAVLPEAKAPKRVVVLDALPRNDRGKVDRDALRALWERDHRR